MLITVFIPQFKAHCYYGGICADTRESYNYWRSSDQPSYSQIGIPPSVIQKQNDIIKAQNYFANNYKPVERSSMGFTKFGGGTDEPTYQYNQVYEDKQGNRYY